MKDKGEEKKTTSEKLVTLSPLKFMEAIARFLKVKPKIEEEKKDQEEGKEEKPSDRG